METERQKAGAITANVSQCPDAKVFNQNFRIGKVFQKNNNNNMIIELVELSSSALHKNGTTSND